MVALPAGILASGFSNALHRRRNSLRRQVGKSLQDGFIDPQERSDLQSQGASMSLARDEVAEILEQEGEAPVGAYCPHCGKRLHLAAGAEPDD